MFVRGGVYRVVKEAMGGTLAKFSVSALMFDYILTGPISGVSAGQYLAGLLNELLRLRAFAALCLHANAAAAAFAIAATIYFWWENIKGIPESSEKALWIMQLTTVMVVALIGWCGYTLLVRGGHLPPAPIPRNIVLGKHSLGWLSGTHIAAEFTVLAVFDRPGPFRSGHERRGIAGAGLPRDRASQAAEPEESGVRYFHLQHGVHVAGFVLRGDDHSGSHPSAVFRESDRRPGDEPDGAVRGATGIPHFRRGGGHADSFGRGEHGDRGLERRSEPRVRRRRSFGVVPAAAPEVWDVVPDHQHRRRVANRDDHCEPRRRDVSREPVRFRRDMEFRAERRGVLVVLRYTQPEGREYQGAAEFPDRRQGNSAGRGESSRWCCFRSRW